MNTYYKLQAHVFLAKCENEYKKGELITITTRRGDEHECIVHNLYANKGEYYYYSVIRADGFDSRSRAIAKAEKYGNWANSAVNSSNKWYEASQEGKDFLSLFEPIKVGHHSEKRHRALIERNWNRMGKSVAFSNKAKAHNFKSQYWIKKAQEINLSMPESLFFFKNQYEKAKKYHSDMKKGLIPRSHSYSLTYAKKDANNFKKKYELAQKLWG